MPELPEVENSARNIDRWVRGARVVAVTVHDPKLGDAGTFERLVGQALVAARRRAKWVLVEFEASALRIHLRMTGHWVRGVDPRRSRLDIGFDNAETIRFVDTRRFGTVELIAPSALAEFEAGLAPEPWPQRRDGPWWRAQLLVAPQSASVARGRATLRAALMDGERVAGLGNIAASEIAWRAALRPDRAVASLDGAEWQMLADAAFDFLDERVRVDAGDGIDYVNEGGANPFDVYQRDRQPCRRCGAPIERVVVAGRSSFFCPSCQR